MPQSPMSFEQLNAILEKIRYKNWKLIAQIYTDCYVIKWVFLEKNVTDSYDNNLYEQHCRKWFISKHSTESEVIRSAYLAAIQAEMHECAEQFQFDNVRLFDPHTSYIDLANYMATAKQDIRD